MTKIVVLTGTFAAGKTVIAEILESKSYVRLGFSDVLRDILTSQRKEINRDTLADLGNTLRAVDGDGVLGARLAEKIIRENLQKVVVDGCRHPLEHKALQEAGEAILVAVDAPMAMRYERSQKRMDDKDRVSFVRFVDQQEAEMNPTVRGGMHLKACMDAADVTVINDGTMKELGEKVEELLALII